MPQPDLYVFVVLFFERYYEYIVKQAMGGWLDEESREMKACEHCLYRLLDNYGSVYEHPCEQCQRDWLELRRLVRQAWDERGELCYPNFEQPAWAHDPVGHRPN